MELHFDVRQDFSGSTERILDVVQIRQGFGVTDIVRAGHDADDFECRFIHAEVEFAPGPSFPDTVLTDFSLAFAVKFDAGRVYNQVA